MSTRFRATLAAIGVFDRAQNYDERNRAIVTAVLLAWGLGLPAGFRIDPNEPEWPVAFIELPTGQISWHLPQYPTPWDGHSTEEKYRRIDEFTKKG